MAKTVMVSEKKGASGSTMPSDKVQGSVSLGTFHGKHDVAHPVQGGSTAQDIFKAGTNV